MIMAVARAGGMSYTEAAALPYDTFVSILYTSNAEGLVDIDRHLEQIEELKKQQKK